MSFGSYPEDQAVFSPHINGGIETRLTKDFAIGLDLTYNFNSEMSKFGFKTDIDGLQANIVARIYF